MLKPSKTTSPNKQIDYNDVTLYLFNVVLTSWPPASYPVPGPSLPRTDLKYSILSVWFYCVKSCQKVVKSLCVCLYIALLSVHSPPYRNFPDQKVFLILLLRNYNCFNHTHLPSLCLDCLSSGTRPSVYLSLYVRLSVCLSVCLS